MLQKLESQVLELYQTVDASVTSFRQATGLACPSGCVLCCFSEKVEATVLEMIPAAFNLFATNQAELLIKRLEREQSLQCILFRPELSSADGGGCSLYPYRALVCRLFGYSGNADRNGVPQLAKCRHMGQPVKSTLADIDSSSTDSMPIFQAFGVTISAIQPDLGTKRMPINQALFEALVKVGLFIELSQSVIIPEEERDEPPDTPATTPPAPIHRRKAA